MNANPVSKPRGEYAKFTLEWLAVRALYAHIHVHGNKAVSSHSSKEMDAIIKPSSLSTWKGNYLAKMKSRIKFKKHSVKQLCKDLTFEKFPVTNSQWSTCTFVNGLSELISQ